MKLKMIALAAVMAVSGAANAALIDSGSATGNGDLVLSIWDKNSAYELNLNTVMNSFVATVTAAPGSAISFAADSTLSTWLAQADSATFKWNVTATGASGTNKAILTSADVTTLPTAESSQIARTAVSSAQSIYNNINANGPLTATVNDAVLGSTTAGYAGNTGVFGSNFGTDVNFVDASSSLGTSMQMVRIGVKSTGSTAVTQAFDGVTVSLDSKGDLTLSTAVAAVPEADTYAMLLAGLGAMGVIVRRRRTV